jgi:hypothetical protein
MNVIELSYEDKCACNKDRFCSFVESQGGFERHEIIHLQSVILNKRLSRVLYVSSMLAVWSMIAAWVDAVILPFIIIYTIALPGAEYYPLLFPVFWTIINATLKFFFVRQRLGGAVSFKDNLVAVLPYAGAAFLMKNWFVGDPLLRKASLSYIKHQKKSAVHRMINFVRGR